MVPSTQHGKIVTVPERTGFSPPRSLLLLKEACDAQGIGFTYIDRFSGFVARLSNDTKSMLVGAAGIGIYPLNRAAPHAVARDKAFTHYLLSQSGFSVPEGEHFFLNPQGDYVRPPGREWADALRYGDVLSAHFAQPLIVKPNAGKGAKLVHFVRNEAELRLALTRIGQEDDLALIQKVVQAPEFRLFLIDGEIAFAYRKATRTIEGDDRSSIDVQCERACAGDPGGKLQLLESSFFQAELARRGLTLQSVLPAGETLRLEFVGNISAGGTFAGFVEPAPLLRAWARRLATAVSLRVTGIDVFSPSHLADPSDIVVTDVNGAPNLVTLADLGHKELVMDVWARILQKTFDEPWPEGF